MDDNENYLEYPKMNFTQFSSPFGGALAANQFAAAKFPPNLTTANGQVLGLVSGGDGGMQFLRPMDGNAMAAATAFQHQQQAAAAAAAANMQQATPAYITLPITMPGAKPGDAQQTVQIQVLNPNPMPQQTQQAPKFQMGQMQIPIQGFQQGTTVLTVAYGPQDEEMMHNHGLPEGMTIVAALQPQDLQLIAQAQNASLLQQHQQHHQHQQHMQNHDASLHPTIKIEQDQPPPMRQIKQEAVWNNIPNLTAAPALGADIAEFLQQRGQSLNLQPFLKFNNNNNNEPNVPLAHGDHLIGGSIPNTPGTTLIKREIIEENSNDNTQYGADSSQADSSFKDTSSMSGDTTSSTLNESSSTPTTTAAAATSTTTPGEDGCPAAAKARKKRKYKSKPPKPKRQKPGQVHITTALDGTVLFCCPECHMAYPEKECLEQHLAVHKIERRFICDICGAGLKRKEHLERHKLGHNPERPYICSVCMKGFKRKEHLNLHFVIHSGVKTEICGDCGKGFYRKDHLRKHIKSHMTKRLKEENAGPTGNNVSIRNNNNNTSSNNNNSSNSGNNNNNNVDNSVSTTSGHTPVSISLPAGIPPGLTITTSTNSMHNHNHPPPQPSHLTQGICLPQGVTIHVPTADNQTLPVQISMPQLVAQQQTAADGTTSTVLVQASEALQHLPNSGQ